MCRNIHLSETLGKARPWKVGQNFDKNQELSFSTIHTVSTTHGRLTGRWGAGLFYLPLLDSTPTQPPLKVRSSYSPVVLCSSENLTAHPLSLSPCSFFQNPWISCSSCPLQKHSHHVACSIQLFSVVLARIFSANPVFNMKALCQSSGLPTILRTLLL